jgi:hypothetical protein
LTGQAVGEFESVWEAAGSRIAGVLDGASAVVVLGHDPIATAAVALGIARAQSTHRRVAVGDMIGDVAPLRELITDDDPHGITDSFQYGVSLNKIARQIDAAGNLHVLPTGSEPIVHEEILRSDRWRRLASGFHEVGALLLLVAPAAIPGVDALADHLDGVILVGGAPNPSPNAHVFAEVSSPARRSGTRPPQRKAAATTAEPQRRRWVGPLIGVAALGIAAVLGGRWYLAQPRAAQPGTASAATRDTTASSGSLAGAGAVVVDSSPPLAPANPGDSAAASAFAVQIAMVDTEDGAAMRVRTGGAHFPVATYAPVNRGSDRGTWYKVVTGAYAERSRADTLLEFIRRNGAVPRGWGTVITAPYALQLATAPSSTEAAALLADFQSKKVPVYGLARDGAVRIYTGAFETPDEAALYKSELKNTKNIDATLVYRVGRAY